MVGSRYVVIHVTVIIQEAKCHSGLKDAALVWLGDSPHLASAGFNMTRNAELAVWDMSNLSKPLTKPSLGTSSTGLVVVLVSYIFVILITLCRSPMLFYDDDTKMLFLAVKVNTLFITVIILSMYLFIE